ncbi:MAG: hypothetical protein COZ49_00510 [Candidatus Yonathbacteria bacterium CG_4_10_14_3_um_filter_47_65]|uniref:Uncharacterized protein n=1 Tax=Candidatus Yonathbacteria bacterium CG_4_9_14_0_8_um_filter_46_47 TaxID=1975106 RepID=A0A2M8D9C8_9BACT|nr:MAG: hypothetical protein COX54_00645 [Candidatus Yonathbacteria bacterium CG23_combo_of_CG06-09_8_20_14_all_46_18]PIQ32655.1 MAG: hypothetical protein COW61_01190 [Candidatus Yonathbacteria bacterium CG17_big_fil_post_rev_8_21_14_2_50_46_19]PIX56732.1 MAG: hypothetical protein COZ49_00510 [Candidatus Yonathbacteria bacterium CG_4_10_14_3_um_filter_47_65]PJB83747.1 MAG: hypothetical protein CO088_00915 [Candidatus Yonathbacteria bacterium CG_4_9_14_0_8_um_filter_46_47]PJC21195.1 MAG: hypothe
MDTEEIEKLLEANLRVSKDNNRMLRKLHQAMIWGRALNTFYWVIIIASFLGLLYFLQPYIDKARSVYLDITSGIKKTENAMESLPRLPVLPR